MMIKSPVARERWSTLALPGLKVRATRAARLLYFLIRPVKFLIFVLSVAVVKAETSFSNDKLVYLRSGIHVKVIIEDSILSVIL